MATRFSVVDSSQSRCYMEKDKEILVTEMTVCYKANIPKRLMTIRGKLFRLKR